MAIEGMAFDPPRLAVPRGTAVTWENRDPFPHTVTADGAFDSGAMDEGTRWRFVASRPGTYEYRCALHPNMHGVLVVE